MTSHIDVRKEFPGLRGLYIHAVDVESKLLEEVLSACGFKVYVIDGIKVSDKRTFFDEAARVFSFPDYFGYGWDGFDDCFSEMRLRPDRRVAIVWKYADQTLSADTQTFLEAVCILRDFAVGLSTYEDGNETIQMEVFLLGHGKGFNVQLQLLKGGPQPPTRL